MEVQARASCSHCYSYRILEDGNYCDHPNNNPSNGIGWWDEMPYVKNRDHHCPDFEKGMPYDTWASWQEREKRNVMHNATKDK